jgi:acetylornithine deacetylase/succinyl-diaminopimelate desuccinylase-like protein
MTARKSILCFVLAATFTSLAGAAGLPPERIEALAAAHDQEALDRYRDLLSLPNDAGNPDDIRRVLEWLERAFAERGFTTQRLEMEGSDSLLATRQHPGANRTVLVYLQADGQPVDPSHWDQPSPWRAALKERAADGTWQILPWERIAAAFANSTGPDPDWRIFGRSASDSKGPEAQFLSALSVLDAAGIEPGFNLKVICDTEEEMGSPHLTEAIGRYRDELAADMLVIFDGPPHVSGEPTLTFGARGIATVTLTTFGPRLPQHSGHWGNYVPNPALRLAQLLASMKDADGRVVIPGYYDGIAIDDASRERLAAVPDDIPAIHEHMGIAEPDHVAPTLQESLQYPSLNIRGLQSGWVGTQSRTIIPAEAVAEIDLRLVRESDPVRLLALIRHHIEAQGFHVIEGRTPTDEERSSFPRLVRMDSEISYPAFRTDADSEPGRWLRAALTRLNGHPPIELRTAGGSIPIAPFVDLLGVPAVQVGTVNPDNNQHSPNENLRVGDFLRGIRTIVAVLAEPLNETSAGAW